MTGVPDDRRGPVTGPSTPPPAFAETLAGRIDSHVIDAPSLVGNPLGDPDRRPLWVYVPPGYDDDPGRRYPAVYVIQGYTGTVGMWANHSAWRVPYPVAADALFAAGEAPPTIVVYVDAWTAYGGSQFVDSPGTGRYHTYLCEDVVGWVDAHYRTLADAAHRGIQGKSSGGFGAMVTPMLRPDLWGALATHAGDSLYEIVYLPEFARAARGLRDFGGSIEAWWADFTARRPFAHPADAALMTVLGCSACFSADDDGTPILPFDPATARLRDDVWARWLAWDPVRMVADHTDALAGLHGIWVDAGRSDDYHLDLGAAAFADALAAVGVHDVAFDLFDGTHSGTDHRYPLSLAYLAERLAP